MPVLSPLSASAIESSTASTSFSTVAETGALAAGVDYIVLISANTISNNNNNTPAQAEYLFGSTRHGLISYEVAVSGAPDSASGGHAPSVFRVTGDGSSTVSVRHRRISGTGNVVTTAHIFAIPANSLTEGTHYWQAQATNTDATVTPTEGGGFIGSGDFVDVTPASTGDFLIIASGEFAFLAGHSASDFARQRVRITEDPTGSATESNLQNNDGNGRAGPETEFTGGADTAYNAGQRFVDVLELTAGTTYRFEVERETAAGGPNIGYRRERVFVFDLSVWPEFTFDRTLQGIQGQDVNFPTISAPAPSQSTDYLLLSALVYSNNNSWLRSHFDRDPSGTIERLPSSAGFGIGLPDTGNGAGDDYGLMSPQWSLDSVTGAQQYRLNGEADLQNCRWGHDRGDFPNAGTNDGIATVTLAWGMETTTSAGPTVVNGSGSTSGSASSTATATSQNNNAGTSGSAAGSASVSATASFTQTIAGSGSAAGTATASATWSAVVFAAGSAAGEASAALVTAPWSLSDSIAWIGNSYTQNFGELPIILQHLIDQRVASNTVSQGPVPHLATSISQRTDGWFTAMTLGGMTLYSDVDQRPGGGQGSTGTTDATDAIGSQPASAYDWVVLTSGLRQESRPGDPDVNLDAAVTRETLPGAGGTGNLYDVNLETTRRAVAEIQATGSTAGYVLRMTQEGFNGNDDTDSSDIERTVRLQVLGARQLLSEGVVDYVVPDHYVWARLQWGAFGGVGSGVSSPVAAYSGLTHSNSQQSGGQNVSWLSRSQGTSGFATNGHQNAIATIVHAWIWGYAMFGIDPRGDTTFDAASGLPSPLDDMISPSGANIYGGHNTGAGNTPYDTGVNPGGPPDSELDLAWNATVRGQIQNIIVAAVDDFNSGTTEFDGLAASGSSAGTSSATATATPVVLAEGSAAGSSTSSAAATFRVVTVASGSASGAANVSGTATFTASTVGSGSASGQGSAAANADGYGFPSMAATGTASASATASATGIIQASGSAAGTSSAVIQVTPSASDPFVRLVSVALSNPIVRIVIQ